MSTPKHTPGPWHIGLKPGPMVYGPQGEQIVGLNVMLDSDEVLANAKFIAAAPEMYEALIAILREADGAWWHESPTAEQVRQAIAQAEGRGER